MEQDMDTMEPESLSASNITSSSSFASSKPASAPRRRRPRTLIHFKKNSKHAVSLALDDLKWNEIRIRIPKSSANTKNPPRIPSGSSPRSSPVSSSASSEKTGLDDEESSDDDDNDEEDMEGGGGANDAAASSETAPLDEVEPVAASLGRLTQHKRGPKRKVKQPKNLLLNLSKYIAVNPRTRATIPASTFSVPTGPSSEKTAWDVAWVDVCSESEFKGLGKYQRVNQFPCMYQLTKKKYLALNLNAMRNTEYESEFRFYPRSWILPSECHLVKEYYLDLDRQEESIKARLKRQEITQQAAEAELKRISEDRILIAKPDFACEGKGIYLVDSLSRIDISIPLVIQQYIPRPLLINQLKFDLRIYVAMTSLSPLSLFVFQDGLTRFCTEEYQQPSKGNLGNTFQHLTNYAINKKNEEKFVYNQDEQHTASQQPQGAGEASPSPSASGDENTSKWSLKSLFEKLGRDYAGQLDLKVLWYRIKDILVKSILASYGCVFSSYRSTFIGNLSPATDIGHCFQLLGFDVLLEADNFTPHLIEINRNCSLKCDSPLDARIKRSLISQLLTLVDIPEDQRIKHKELAEMEKKKRREMSAAEFRKFQSETLVKMRDEWRYDYEDTCVRKFALEQGGGWERIYPTTRPSATKTITTTETTDEAAAQEADVTNIGSKAYLAARQQTYEGIITRSIQLQSSPASGASPASSTPSASSSSSSSSSSTIARKKIGSASAAFAARRAAATAAAAIRRNDGAASTAATSASSEAVADSASTQEP